MRRLLPGLILGLAACSGVHSASGGPSPSPAPPPRASASAALPPIRIDAKSRGRKPVKIVQQRANRKLYELTAVSYVSTRLPDGTFTVLFKRPHVIFYERTGKTLTGDAPTATVDDRSRTVAMSGGVRARTQDGVLLTCRTLTYNYGTERLHGVGDVNVLHGEQRMQGERIDGDVELQKVQMNGS